MLEVQRISEEQKCKINAKLKPYGLELAGCSVADRKATLSINKHCAATYDYRKVANMLKNSFDTTLSAIIVDGREFVF